MSPPLGPVTSSRCTPPFACRITAEVADDRHSLAPASRFLEDDVLSALDIQELAPARPRSGSVAGAHSAITVDLDHLWS